MNYILSIIKDPFTLTCLLIIICLFLHFWLEAKKITKAKIIIEKALKSTDSLVTLGNSKLSTLKNEYLKHLTIQTADGVKTNIPANEIFSVETLSKAMKWNMRMVDAASSTLVGLGLLGTFLGLTIGICGFDSSSSKTINESIQKLLNGMGTAFTTSLFGMACSLIYTIFEKIRKNKLTRTLYEFTEKLDEQYYIDDIVLIDQNQKALFGDLCNTILNSIEKQLTYSNENGQKMEVSNAIREILKENEEQSKALKSFSTDLALELNNGFDEVMSRQLQEKLLPLMENIDGTTKAVVEHIDQMAANVASPATDMIQNVVDELKSSMTSIMKEFKNNLSGDATQELEELAKSLGTATQAMANFPKNMENISATLQITIEEVKNAISDISNTSAHANSAAMQQMQEQITFATGSISNAIEEVKDVMSNISQSSQEQSNQMVNKLADAAEKMGSFLTGTISTLSSSVQQSVQSITDDVNSKQADLIALQEDTTSQTKRLLDTFNVGLDRLSKMNDYIVGTMNGFKQAQGEITTSTSNLRTISGDMKLSTELFNKSKNDYTDQLLKLQIGSQHGIDQIKEMLKDSGQLSEEYAQKFEIIKQGLGSIFSQIQNGLNEYSRTVKDSTDKYLSQYTNSLTQTTGALASSIERQTEITDMLTDALKSSKQQ